MTQEKHSPAPWHFDGTVVMDSNLTLLHNSNRTQEETKANAKLIAAAPELLENLTRILDRIRESQLQYYFPSAFDRAEAAIKKATL